MAELLTLSHYNTDKNLYPQRVLKYTTFVMIIIFEKLDLIMSDKIEKTTKQKCFENKRKSLGSYCAAINCHNTRGNCTLSMFIFPKDEERCKKWVQNLRREDIIHTPLHKLCHFQL